MSASGRSELFLMIPLYLAVLAMLVVDAIGKVRRKAREKACSARIAELRRVVWESPEVGAGEAADIGVLIARADRADRWARATERDALAAMIEGGVPAGKSAASLVFGQADYAVDAEARLEQVLNGLRKRLPEAAGAELEVAQSAFRDYRDAHVRLCRDLRDGDDRMLVRHYASEAITRARISDLEDVLAIARLQD